MIKRLKQLRTSAKTNPKIWGMIGFIVSMAIVIVIFTVLQNYRQHTYQADFANQYADKNKLVQYWLNAAKRNLEQRNQEFGFKTAQYLKINDRFKIEVLESIIKKQVLNYKDPILRNAVIGSLDRQHPKLLFYKNNLVLLSPDIDNHLYIGLLPVETLMQQLLNGEQGYLLQESNGRFTTELFRSPGLLQYNQALDTDTLFHDQLLDVFKQTWRLAVVIPPQFFLGNWVLLCFGVILSGILAWFIYNKLARNIVLNNILEQRSIELKEARTALEQQSVALIEAREKALEASKAKGDFLANMSHEIRTPLNSMIGITELLLDTTLNNHQAANMRMVLTSAETLLEIINDILDFSKIESGKLNLEPIECNLYDIINDTAELFANRANDKSTALQLLTHITSNTPALIKADPVRLKQIICNLTSNAIKFTEAGFVKIKVEELTDLSIAADKVMLKFSVEDTGIGIPEEKRQTIFEKFSQADASTTRNFGGTGLGLSISQQLSEMMGGTIGVESVLGQGSTFWCTAVLGRLQEQPVVSYQNLKGKRLLVIEELLASAQILEDHLSHINIDVVVTQSGSKGLHILQTAYNAGRPFDGLLIDSGLSDIPYNKIIRSIKASKIFKEIPAIVLSSTDCKDFPLANGYLHKPLDVRTLYRMLNQLFTGQNTRQLTPYNVQVQQQKQDIDISYFEGAEILLVDDSRANLMFGTELLEKYGCVVTTAKNGKIAVEIIQNRTFDLILMDCQMPIMDGFEASRKLRTLKESNRIKDIPIVALTANAMQGDREKCLEAGMCDYITKPIRKKPLETLLRQWLPVREERLLRYG